MGGPYDLCRVERVRRRRWVVADDRYKYLLDVDGNGWSARFKRLLSTNSVVLKSTIFPEWFTDHIQPWVHYVPLKPDLTDLYDVMTFFRDGHDELAKRIAVESKKWSKQFWRKEDMMAYQFRWVWWWVRVLTLGCSSSCRAWRRRTAMRQATMRLGAIWSRSLGMRRSEVEV